MSISNQLETQFESRLELATSATRVSVFEPRSSDVRILLVNLKFEVGYPLRKSDCSYDSRYASSHTDNPQRPFGVNCPFIYD